MLSEKPKSGLSDSRKMTKSTMEKKRRARINNSLTELKSILSGMITNKDERFDKMEKADILEMTVKCVRQLQKQTHTGDSTRMPAIPGDEDYRSGMHTCMSEVIKFISSNNLSDTDPEVKTRLLDHLATKLHSGRNQEVYPNPGLTKACQEHSFDTTFRHNSSSSFSTSSEGEDSNINLQEMNDKHSPSPTESSPMVSPVFAPVKSVQPVMDTVQPPQSVPTVPLTILVPANICSAAVGTTCVIPINLPTASPQTGHTGILATVTQPSQTNFAVNSGSGLSLISASNILPNSQGSPTGCDIINLSPESRVYAFTRAVVPDGRKGSEGPAVNTVDAIKSNTVSSSPVFQSLSNNREIINTPLKLNNTPASIQTFNHQILGGVTDSHSKHATEFSDRPRVLNTNENYMQTCPFRGSGCQNTAGQSNQDSGPVEYNVSKAGGTISETNKRHFIETGGNTAHSEDRVSSCNAQLGNICDSTTIGMWRPW